jgi:UDP-N-acetylmuramoyl-tripeptide--D-alanyl-D-alanine ligase
MLIRRQPFNFHNESANMLYMSQFSKLILNPLKKRVKVVLAEIYRPVLRNVCFIAVTGSCGKSTATELIAAILEKGHNVRKRSHLNTAQYVADTILTVSLKHHFCVHEISVAPPGMIEKSSRLLKPQIVVVTNVGQDHYGHFRRLDDTAAEKGKLVEALPDDGCAILNADDPLVYEMRKRTKARVITFGLSAEALVRGKNVSCVWPQRLSMDVCFWEKCFHVQTRLLGEHWAAVVLAAFATAAAAGVSFQRAIEAVETFEPILNRMSPCQTPQGITFVSDNNKSPLWTIPAAADFMRKAKARRKICIIGSVSDTPKSFYDRYKAVVLQMLDAVDKIIFVGQHAITALRVRTDSEDQRIMAFSTIGQLDAFLKDYLRQSDLVLLKGTENIDHLQRIILSRTTGAACLRVKCIKKRYCSECHHLFEIGDAGGPPTVNAAAGPRS